MLAWDVCPGEETFAAYVAGRLARDERDAVDSHLDTCSACQELVAMLAKLEPPRSAGVAATIEEVAATDESWNPGGQLGRYVLLARLGVGGMGVVYAAYDPELDRRVALKVLRRARAGDQLREEARAIARLAHPNVVAVHDVGNAGDELFVAMEYVDGVTVRDWLVTKRTPAAIIDVFVQAARGLAAAHRVGLVHRDIKPSNIMIGSDGRARVLDFGLARAADDHDANVAGTPAYMAPEQERGERIDARADQFAFCVSLWEALGGKRETSTLDGVSERVVRALRKGLAPEPSARFATMDELIRELAPPARHARTWVIATCVAVVALAGTLAFTFSRSNATPSCARAGDPAAAVWNDAQRSAVRSAFAATKVPYAASSANAAIAQLDRWASQWQVRATASCRATTIDRVEPAALHATRLDCLGQLLDRMRPIVSLATNADADVVARADQLAASVPLPERCDDVAALASLPPAERDRDAVAALRAELAAADAELLAGRAPALESRVAALAKRSEALGYAPLRAQGQLLLARYELSLARYDQAIASYHAAAQAASAARDLALLAEIWIELSQTLGNDLRTLDQADVFDRYAQSLIAQLQNHDALELRLEFARCNRNGDPRNAAQLAAHCQATIDRALRMSPPRPTIANAARARLGHFQRLQGHGKEAIATLVAAVDEAETVHGRAHPDTAVARYSLGIAQLGENHIDEAIAQLRQALEIRRAAFPAGNIQIAESLQGLADAVAVKGDHKEAIALLEQALAMLDTAHAAESAHAANCHLLLGMSLEEAKRDDDALVHYLRGADIADRSLQHREALAAMALRLAANIEANHGRAPTGATYLERALRLQERGKVPPAELGKTQFLLAQLLGSSDRVRARALAQAARASFVADGVPTTEVDAFLKKH